MKTTKKLTANIPIDLDNMLSSFCERKKMSKEKATERAIRNMLSADAYMLEVARIGIKNNAA